MIKCTCLFYEQLCYDHIMTQLRIEVNVVYYHVRIFQVWFQNRRAKWRKEMRKIGSNSCLRYYNSVPVTDDVAADLNRRFRQNLCGFPVVPQMLPGVSVSGVSGMTGSSMPNFWYSQALRYSNGLGDRCVFVRVSIPCFLILFTFGSFSVRLTFSLHFSCKL